jgi:hypothetical protein
MQDGFAVFDVKFGTYIFSSRDEDVKKQAQQLGIPGWQFANFHVFFAVAIEAADPQTLRVPGHN